MSEYQKIRMKFWSDVWLNVASSSSTTTKNIPTAWADEALKQFDERFPIRDEDDKES